MPIVDMNSIQSAKVDKPFERELKVIMSPDTDAAVQGFSLIESILAPNGGCTDLHAHPVSGELMIIMSGSGRAWMDGKEFELKPGVAMYAPPGVEHKTLNTGSEPVRIACVFVPAIDTSYIMESVKAAKSAGEKNNG
ncbi:MAG TPA: cupin domain-containing protein [Spirochaetota bacterium]|nr:cupin domain-containing protein [Spirochaetota bacterium]